MSAKILSKVMEYCTYHVAAKSKTDDDKPAKTDEEISAWDKEFVKVDQATLFELILVRLCLLQVILMSPESCSTANAQACSTAVHSTLEFPHSVHTEQYIVPADQQQRLFLKCIVPAFRRPTTSTSSLCWIWAASR